MLRAWPLIDPRDRDSSLFAKKISDFGKKRYVWVYKSCQIDKLFLIQVTILKILKILKISIHSRSDSRRWRGNILTYLIFIIIQLNLCSRDLDLPPGYIIWISRTWFLSRNFHLKIFDFYEIQEFFYESWEKSCLFLNRDLLLRWYFCPKMQIFIIFEWFFQWI